MVIPVDAYTIQEDYKLYDSKGKDDAKGQYLASFSDPETSPSSQTIQRAAASVRSLDRQMRVR